MNIHAQLIVLRITPLSDSSRVLHTLSDVWGRRSFIISAAKGSTLYQPLSILDVEAVQSTKSDMWRLKNVEAVDPLTSIRSSRYKTAIALFMSEVLYRAVHEGSDDPDFFTWCKGSIFTLESLEDSFSSYHLRWLLELCSAMGFSPSANSLAPFAGEYLELFKGFTQGSFASSLLIPLSGQTRSRMASILLEYLSAHAECRIEAKSLAVLSELF